jgi:hypothetical protein
LGGEPGYSKECGQRRGECLPVMRVELAGQGGQVTYALLSPRLDHLGTGEDTQRLLTIRRFHIRPGALRRWSLVKQPAARQP